MKTNQLHPRIAALKLKAKAINSPSYVDANGDLHLVDMEGNPIDFKVKVLDEKARTIEGYLAVFGTRDLGGEVSVKGCFLKSISERGPKSKANNKIVMLWQHDMRDPIGKFIELKEDDYGLYFKAVLDNIPQGLRALEQITSGTLNQFSYGYKYLWDKTKYDEDTDSIMLMEVALWEGSVCTFGMHPGTYAIKTFEEFTDAKEALEIEAEDFLKTLPETKKNEFRQLMTKQAELTSLEPLYLEVNNQKKTLKPATKEASQVISWGGRKINFKQKEENETKKFDVKW